MPRSTQALQPRRACAIDTPSQAPSAQSAELLDGKTGGPHANRLLDLRERHFHCANARAAESLLHGRALTLWRTEQKSRGRLGGVLRDAGRESGSREGVEFAPLDECPHVEVAPESRIGERVDDHGCANPTGASVSHEPVDA